MYTVKELIEALKQCPEDYEVKIVDSECSWQSVDTIGIDHNAKSVDLFAV